MAEINFPTTPKKPLNTNPKSLVLFSKPKQGKTTALSLLKNNLIIDLEEGSDHVGGLTVKANSFKELSLVRVGLKKQAITYDYITFDTTTMLEEYSKELAKKLYQDTPMGKNWGKPHPVTGKILPGQDDITKLPNGAGYFYVRQAFLKIIDGFRPFVNKCIILSGHVNDKLVNKEGEEVSEMQLDLSGKLARIVCSKVDSIGLLHRKKDKVYVNFDGGGDSIIESRSEHLRGKEILLTEKDDSGEIKAYWNKIFKETN